MQHKQVNTTIKPCNISNIDNIEYHILQNTHLSAIVGPLMEPKPKLFVKRNVVFDPINMKTYGNPISFL